MSNIDNAAFEWQAAKLAEPSASLLDKIKLKVKIDYLEMKYGSVALLRALHPPTAERDASLKIDWFHV